MVIIPTLKKPTTAFSTRAVASCQPSTTKDSPENKQFAPEKYWAGVSNIFLFSSLFGEMIQFDSYFSDGLKPPTETGLDDPFLLRNDPFFRGTFVSFRRALQLNELHCTTAAFPPTCAGGPWSMRMIHVKKSRPRASLAGAGILELREAIDREAGYTPEV